MTHKDHVFLIQNAIKFKGPQVWADFGSGWGAFTLALRDLAGDQAEIFSIDKNKHSLQQQSQQFKKMFPKTKIKYLYKDFTKELELPPLDGIIMANSLHYIRDQESFLKVIKKYLKREGKILIVEYDTDSKNTWLPFPLSFSTFRNLSKKTGYVNSTLLNTIKLEWLNMYSAEAYL